MQIDPRQLQRMMQQMGIKSEKIDANRVIIEKDDEKLVLNNPSVVKMQAQGETSFQITCDNIEVKPVIPAEDIELVMAQANAPRERALSALDEANGDVAEAIMKLKKS
ncbi:Nascent polypeptide-associated complex protein [uncultured archaeon]|nr:Nascent polypeptide-associated complex protein [uncultured archaeon]